MLPDELNHILSVPFVPLRRDGPFTAPDTLGYLHKRIRVVLCLVTLLALTLTTFALWYYGIRKGVVHARLSSGGKVQSVIC